MIAYLEAKRAGLFKKPHWANNLLAGIIVGIVALPLAWHLPLPLAQNLSKVSILR